MTPRIWHRASFRLAGYLALLLMCLAMSLPAQQRMTAVAVGPDGFIKIPTNFWTVQTNDPIFWAFLSGLPGTNWIAVTYATNIVPIVQVLNIVSNTVTLDGSLGNKFSLLLTNNVFMAQPTNLQPLKDYMIDVRQDSAGNRLVSWDTNYWRFPSKAIWPVTPNANAWTLISAIADCYGTNLGVVQTLNLK